jgi:hypothetical protein
MDELELEYKSETGLEALIELNVDDKDENDAIEALVVLGIYVDNLPTSMLKGKMYIPSQKYIDWLKEQTSK